MGEIGNKRKKERAGSKKRFQRKRERGGGRDPIRISLPQGGEGKREGIIF